jgi:glycosyltransferase involved in cell wall biosynthesis
MIFKDPRHVEFEPGAQFPQSIQYTQPPLFRQTKSNVCLWYSAAMRLLFVADGRSTTALSWLEAWTGGGAETHLVSTFPCDPPPGLKSFHILPVAFSWMMKPTNKKLSSGKTNNRYFSSMRNQLRPLRSVAGPFSLLFYQSRFRNIVKEIHPELVHALRIPFEGMLANSTPKGIPLVVSVWGNDITLHAHSSIFMAALTRKTLSRADGLVADAHRDIRLGVEWGFSAEKPTLVVPGAGGIHLDEMESLTRPLNLPEELSDVPIVVNPRGQRPGSLRQDIFFQAIPIVLEKCPQTQFICPNLEGDAEAEYWVQSLGIRLHTKLWPRLEQSQMWRLFKKAIIFVSPSVHDGTPNSLLEAMASGCLPIVGNIESMQEWVKPGENGLLVDATNPMDLANGIIFALQNPKLREGAKKENARIIAERASYDRCMAMTKAFYKKVLKNFPAGNIV